MTGSQREVFNRREIWGLWGFGDLKGLWKEKKKSDGLEAKGDFSSMTRASCFESYKREY